MPDSTAQLLATLSQAPAPPPPSDLARRLTGGMLTDDSYYDSMNPIDRLALSMQPNRAPVSKEQQAANAYQTTHDVASMLPWVGSAVAMKDAWDDSGHGAEAIGEGRYKDAAGNYVSMLANTLGAVLPYHLPNSSAARQAAKDAPTQANIFAGVNAKTADNAALGEAREMDARGLGRDAIWDQTGWFKGVDGKWRFEIDDSGRVTLPHKLEPHPHPAMPTARVGKLGDYQPHPERDAAYPDMRNTQVTYLPAMTEGYYGTYQGPPTWKKENISIMGAAESPSSTTLHETQHGLQYREGFAKGGSPDEFKTPENTAMERLYDHAYLVANRMRYLHETAEEAAKHISSSPGAASNYDVLRTLGTRHTPEELLEMSRAHKPYEQYRRLAGEVEARNVQARRAMSAAERQDKAPWYTQDVPDERQVVRLDSPASGAASAGETPTPWVGWRHDAQADSLAATMAKRRAEAPFDASPYYREMAGAEDAARADTASIAEVMAKRAADKAQLQNWLDMFDETKPQLTSYGRRKKLGLED